MLRQVLLVCVWLFAAGALVLTVQAPEAWPSLLMAGLLVLGVAYERFHYRGNVRRDGGGRWEETSERFRDEESGAMVTVWFNAATGERRYVEAGEAPPGR